MNASRIETPPDLPDAPLRRNQGFRLLWVGQLLSDTGSDVGLLAYPLLILALTHSAVLAGTVGTAREVALISLQLPAGALSDWLDRRLTMIVCDVMRAAPIAALGVAIVVHLASWPVVLVVSVIEGGASAIFNPVATAALPGIVPDGQLEEAWAATEARTWGASLAGTALGGVLFGLGRAVPSLADAVSYGASFGTVSRIRGRFRPEQAAERKTLWHEVADGLHLVWKVPILRATVLTAPLASGWCGRPSWRRADRRPDRAPAARPARPGLAGNPAGSRVTVAARSMVALWPGRMRRLSFARWWLRSARRGGASRCPAFRSAAKRWRTPS